MSLGDKERQLAEGHAELDRVLKEGRHVESQVRCAVPAVLASRRACCA